MFAYRGVYMMRAERGYSVRHMEEKQRMQHMSNHRRRVRQLRRRVFATALTLGISLIMGILGCSILSEAQTDDTEISYKYFMSIQVKPGDTLLSIAGVYADEHYESVYAYMEEVCLTNHLLDEKICAGDYLIVPYYSTEFR